MESADLEVVRDQLRTRCGTHTMGNDRGSWMTAAHLSCLVRICPAALACVRTSCLNEDTASTINFFIPSIESSSSNEKSNFCGTVDPRGRRQGWKEENIGRLRRRGLKKKCTYRFTDRFVGRIVPCLQVGMVQRLLTADPLRRVKTQHLRQEVDSKRVSIGVQGCKGYSGFDG